MLVIQQEQHFFHRVCVFGPTLGKKLGRVEGLCDIVSVGPIDGNELGFTLGELEGPPLGEPEGPILGELEGATLGELEAATLGEPEGPTLGQELGWLDGL